MPLPPVTLICVDEASTLATIALRGSLEYFGFVASTHWIGNKKQFLASLQKDDAMNEIIVLSAHGAEGKFFLPNNESVAFDAMSVRLPKRTVISTGCDTYGAADAFLNGECASYIAPSGYPEGNDANFFVTKFFWLLAQGKSVHESFAASEKDMPKGSEYMMRQGDV